MTPIDIAHADMKADESNDTARLRFYERLIDCELFMLLEAESDGIIAQFCNCQCCRRAKRSDARHGANHVTVFELDQREP